MTRFRLSFPLRFATALVAALIGTRWPALAEAGAAARSVGTDVYSRAAARAGVDLDILIAVAGAESAYHPYALNLAGHQIFCLTRAEAEAVLNRATTDNIDIGLMQINWRIWGARSGLNRASLLDPATNLLLGAQILRESLRRNGSLWDRIGDYHSSSPRERDRYNQQVYNAYLRYKRGVPR